MNILTVLLTLPDEWINERINFPDGKTPTERRAKIAELLDPRFKSGTFIGLYNKSDDEVRNYFSQYNPKGQPSKITMCAVIADQQDYFSVLTNEFLIQEVRSLLPNIERVLLEISRRQIPELDELLESKSNIAAVLVNRLSITGIIDQRLLDKTISDKIEGAVNNSYMEYTSVEGIKAVIDLIKSILPDTNLLDLFVELAASASDRGIVIKHGSYYGYVNYKEENISHKLIGNVAKVALMNNISYTDLIIAVTRDLQDVILDYDIIIEGIYKNHGNEHIDLDLIKAEAISAGNEVVEEWVNTIRKGDV